MRNIKTFLISVLLIGCTDSTSNQISDMKVFLDTTQRQINSYKVIGDHKSSCHLYNDMIKYLHDHCPDLIGLTAMCVDYKDRDTEECSKYTN